MQRQSEMSGSRMDALHSAEARRIRRSLQLFTLPRPFCRACLRSRTLASSMLKQASMIATCFRNRIRPGKNYARLCSRLESHGDNRPQ